MRTATVERFWNSQKDRLAKKTPRCVVTVTERNKVKTWELDLDTPAHCEIEKALAYGKTYTCLYNGEERFADGPPFEIVYTTRKAIDLLVNVGEPISIRTVPPEPGYEKITIRTEVLRSLSEKPMQPNQLACHIWRRLDRDGHPNPYKGNQYIPIRSTLNRLLEDGSVVELRRGIYTLSDDGRHELFRESMMVFCMNEREDTASVPAQS